MKNPFSRWNKYLSEHADFKNLLKNASVLFSGNFVAAVLGLVAIAILTRSLQLEVFGLYTLCIAYVTIVDRLANFQIWQALIHYGAAMVQKKSLANSSSLLAFGFLVDLFGCVLGFLIALAGAIWLPHLFGLAEIQFTTLVFASVTLLFNWVGTPTAIFRLLDEYKIQAITRNIPVGIHVIGYFFLWLNNVENLSTFIYIWAFGVIVYRIIILMVGLRLAIKRDVFSLTTIDLKQMLAASPRIWKFIFTSYLEGTVRMIREFDIFIVNYFTNTASTGLYKIAREMARAATRLTGPFHQAIYPNLAKMKVSENFLSFRKLVIQSSVTLGTMVFVGFLVFLMLGEYLLIGIFGESYSAAYRPAIFCIFGIVIWGLSLIHI